MSQAAYLGHLDVRAVGLNGNLRRLQWCCVDVRVRVRVRVCVCVGQGTVHERDGTEEKKNRSDNTPHVSLVRAFCSLTHLPTYTHTHTHVYLSPTRRTATTSTPFGFKHFTPESRFHLLFAPFPLPAGPLRA